MDDNLKAGTDNLCKNDANRKAFSVTLSICCKFKRDIFEFWAYDFFKGYQCKSFIDKVEPVVK